MLTRESVIGSLEDSFNKIDDEISDLSIYCDKHDLGSRPEADACPCQAKLYWMLDHLDESI